MSVAASCEALQAVERLYIQLKQDKEHTDDAGICRKEVTLEIVK